jgi:hypothetical protein
LDEALADAVKAGEQVEVGSTDHWSSDKPNPETDKQRGWHETTTSTNNYTYEGAKVNVTNNTTSVTTNVAGDVV